MNVPACPSIYHITHVDNLPSIIATGGLISEATMATRGGPSSTIGMSAINVRRLRLPVDCHPGDHVGDYVPFYFCPRSVMLYVIHRGNNPELTYKGGQEPIVHLEADLAAVVRWAETQSQRWASSLSNAGARYTSFRNDLAQLRELKWDAIQARDFRDPTTKEGKQAEFLVHGFFPWHLVSRIAVYSPALRDQADQSIPQGAHRPQVEVRRDWYF